MYRARLAAVMTVPPPPRPTCPPMASDQPTQPLTALLDGLFAAHVLLAGTRLKVYTKCADTPQDAATLARRCEVHPEWMRLLLDANVALGLLEATPDGYRPTPLAAEYLNEQKHGALTNAIKFALTDEAPAWTDLSDIIRGRRPGPDLGTEEREHHTRARAYGKAVWPALFADACRCMDAAGVNLAVDIGSGLTPLGLAVLKFNGEARLLVIDWPSYETPLWKTMTHSGYRARTTFVGGDPVTTTPRDSAADLALLGGILGRSRSDRRVALLQAAAATLRPGGRVHIQDAVDGEGPSAPVALARLRAAMLFGVEGLSRLTADGLRDALHEAGFSEVAFRAIPDSSATCVTAVRA